MFSLTDQSSVSMQFCNLFKIEYPESEAGTGLAMALRRPPFSMSNKGKEMEGDVCASPLKSNVELYELLKNVQKLLSLINTLPCYVVTLGKERWKKTVKFYW